ncbi:TetR/AcrR family transcriptional regulator [Actinophytocola sp. KF-1]
MNAVTDRAPAAARRQPRDRKTQIIAVAADHFYRLGYHNVGTEDVASTVGITAGALYRHFGTSRSYSPAPSSTDSTAQCQPSNR